MAYIDQATLELVAGGAEKLIQLTDQDDAGALNEEKMELAIDYAQSIVDSYISNIMHVPVAAPTKALKIHTALVAIYQLKSWANGNTADDDRNHNEVTLAWLRGVGKGEIGIDSDPEPPTNSDRPDGAYPRSSIHDVSRKKLGGVIW